VVQFPGLPFCKHYIGRVKLMYLFVIILSSPKTCSWDNQDIVRTRPLTEDSQHCYTLSQQHGGSQPPMKLFHSTKHKCHVSRDLPRKIHTKITNFPLYTATKEKIHKHSLYSIHGNIEWRAKHNT
jgi:hypothetical protein